MSENAEVKIGGDSREGNKALVDFAYTVKDTVGQALTNFTNLTVGIGKVGVALSGLAVAAGVGFMLKSIKETITWNQEVYNLAKTLGITTQEAMTLNVALENIDVSQSTYIRGVLSLTSRLKELEPILVKNGIAVRDSVTGRLKDGASIMQGVADKLSSMTSATDRNRAGLAFFSRQWNDLSEIVKLNAKEVDNARAMVEKYQLTADPQQLQRYKDMLDEVQLAKRALSIQAGTVLLPVLISIGEWFGNKGPSQVNFFVGILREAAVITVGLASGFELLATILGGVGAMFAAILDPTVKVKDVWREMVAEITRLEAKFEKFKDGTYNPKSTDMQGGGGGGMAFEGKEGKGKKGDNLSEWKAELQKMRDSVGAFHKLELIDELRFWDEKQEIANRAGAWGTTEFDKVFHERIEIMRKMHQREIAESDAHAQQMVSMQTSESDRAIARTRYQEQMGFITSEQALANIRQFEELKYQAQRSALEKRIALYENDKEKKAQLNRELERLDYEHLATLERGSQEQGLILKKQWEDILGAITSAFDTSIKGMILGTQTWRQALSNIFQSILGEFINLGVKMVKDWIMKEILMTKITQIETASRTVLAQLGATGTVAAKVGEATTVVSANAAEAASGAAASQASIPYVGPALAAAAFASIMALVMGAQSMFSAEGGAWSLPSDGALMAHKDEMVLPPDLARDVREAVGAGGGGGGRGGVNIHIHAMDSKDVTRALENNGVLRQAVDKLVRTNQLRAPK